MIKKICIGFMLVCFLGSCGEYENLELKNTLNRRADSLFRTKRDSLSKLSTARCDSSYQFFYTNAVDSIKKIQLSKIEDLFKK